MELGCIPREVRVRLDDSHGSQGSWPRVRQGSRVIDATVVEHQISRDLIECDGLQSEVRARAGQPERESIQPWPVAASCWTGCRRTSRSNRVFRILRDKSRHCCESIQRRI